MRLKGIGLAVVVVLACHVFAALLAATFGWDYADTLSTLYAGTIGYLCCEVVARGDA
jgi:hypothetical protein